MINLQRQKYTLKLIRIILRCSSENYIPLYFLLIFRHSATNVEREILWFHRHMSEDKKFLSHVWLALAGVFHCRCVWPHSKFSKTSTEECNSPACAVVASAPRNYFSGIRAESLTRSWVSGAISNGFNLCGWKFIPLGPVSIGAKSMTNELEECRVGRKWILSGENRADRISFAEVARKSRGFLCCRRDITANSFERN